MPNISLVGFMGSGKTTVGNLLAKQLGFNFVDLDRVIEGKLDMEIDVIFSKFGEEYFRDVEAEVIKEVLSGVDNTVISCGGGVVLREGNVNVLRERSIVIYLRISADEAYRRLKHCDDRPLLKDRDKKAVINDLLRIREPLYLRAAHMVVDVDGKEPQDLVNELLQKLPTEVVGDSRSS
ncbi:MAG: shikimate kinase [Sulfolobales archaeon]|nr:shikimate kinase [Sulfolobales archaeon]